MPEHNGCAGQRRLETERVKSQIMYLEVRGPDGSIASARIGRVSHSKTGKTIYYGGKAFQRVGRAEYVELQSGDHYWISACRRDGNDRGGNNPGSFPIEIDDDVRQEYWKQVRGQPERANERVTYG